MHRKIKQYINKYADLGYGEDHLLFAAHAAFPTGVTPHLLYQMWANFSVIPGREEVLDYVVVSDFLLSNLCRETSLGIFEINGRIRTELLEILEKDPRFGPKRLKELAYFLYQYIQKGNQEEDFAVFREAQYWTALSVIAPQKAASEIGQILSDKIKTSDSGEILRISSLLEQIGQKNQSFDNLVNYAQGLKDGLLDRPQAAQQAFNKVMVIGPEDPDQETFALKIPLMSSVVNPSTNFQKAPSAAERTALERIAEAGEQLYLSDIPGLKKIPEAVKELEGLRELVAKNSDLEEVPAFLEEITSLEAVILGQNQIKHLPATFPQGLKYLDLRYNQLTSIDRDVFLLENLEHLNLESNELQIMPGTVINATENRLSVLETRNNPWLNLPIYFDFPGDMDLLLERWQRTFSTIETIQLIDLGAQQGELYLDIQDGFRPWMALGSLNIELSVVQQRFALYPVQDRFEYPGYPSLRVLYLTGENFELIVDMEGEDKSILSPADLVQLWQPYKEIANLIVLNISESIPYAQALVNNGFKAVIAADFTLSESQRFNFQNEFFEALQAGNDLRSAYDAAATGGPIQKGNFAQQSKVQQSSYSEGPDLSIELNSWRIIENTEREVRTDWEWKLPDLVEADAAESPEQPSGNPLLDAWKRGMKSQLAGEDIEDYLETMEAKIQLESTSYDNLVNISAFYYKKRADYNQSILPEDALSTEKQITRTKLLTLVDQISVSAYQVSQPKIATDRLTQLKYTLKTHLRKYEMKALWNSLDDNLIADLPNYDGFLLQGRYWQYEKNRAQYTSLQEEDDTIIRSIIAATYAFIDQLDSQQLNAGEDEKLTYSSQEAFFVASVLQLLAANEVENALFYFNDYTVSTPEFMERFNEWLERYDKNQSREKEEGKAYQLFLQLRNQTLQDFKVFLEDIASGDFLIDDFLLKRTNDLQEEINALNAQKAFDERQMDALREELRLIQEMDRPPKGLEWPQVRTLYSLIADNEVLTAAEIFFKDAFVIDEKLAQQGQQIYDSLNQLERDREKMPFEDYQKEFNSLLEGLMITINDLWRDRPEEHVDDPDLIQYLRATAERQIEAGQLKQTFDYLLNSLDPASSLMEDTVELSAKYYLLEAAQYQENIDYKGVLDQLNSTTRYLRNIIQSEALRLQSNFVVDELERVEQALKALSEKGKSKKFNIRDDGDYQELQAARNLLRKFL
ncbi:MAG: hypothetical protein Sapg2KO_36010 [Saprospiraceae bacterium]